MTVIESSLALTVVRISPPSSPLSTYLSTHSPIFSANRPFASRRIRSTPASPVMVEKTRTQTGTIGASPLFAVVPSGRDKTQEHLPHHLGGRHRRLIRRLVAGCHLHQDAPHHPHFA